MNYEQMYKETRRWIESIYPELGHEKQMLAEKLFPELKESEDERIKEEIIEQINLLKSATLSDLRDKQFNSWIAWLEKQGEQKPTDKVKPKFKVRDWIVFNGLVLYIKEVVKGYYRTVSRNGIPISYNWDVDKLARLWTVQDAMDGDVLIVGDEDDTGIAICGKNDKLGNNILYCYYDDENGFAMNTPIASECLLHPATKEQSDLLFAKMREAGYVWDIYKKEVRKIKQKSDSFCKENCKGFQETDKCFADGECKAKKEAEQKSAWSEEDEQYVKDIMHRLNKLALIIGHSLSTHSIKQVQGWLKSLKDRVQPQNTWKPSDEQMNVLWCNCSEGSLLLSLYNDLKKLKEE